MCWIVFIPNMTSSNICQWCALTVEIALDRVDTQNGVLPLLPQFCMNRAANICLEMVNICLLSKYLLRDSMQIFAY